jgi:hypothetical protein
MCAVMKMLSCPLVKTILVKFKAIVGEWFSALSKVSLATQRLKNIFPTSGVTSIWAGYNDNF